MRLFCLSRHSQNKIGKEVALLLEAEEKAKDITHWFVKYSQRLLVYNLVDFISIRVDFKLFSCFQNIGNKN